MDFDLKHGAAVLERTPGVLRGMLAGLDDCWVRTNYGPETFSPFDVIGHLIHGERTDWIPRARIILQHGEGRAFEPFDRYAMYQDSRGRSLEDLLDTFAAVRGENLAALRSMEITAEMLALRGTHPDLGAVTLGQLLATWVVHDLNHIHQIAKCMAFQYRGAMGSWASYVGVLKNFSAE